jgi:hypothetical protein
VGRYQSKITGKFVSEYWAKRHPKSAVELPPQERRTVKGPAVPSKRITLEQASEAARKVQGERPRLPLIGPGKDPTLGEHFEAELYEAGRE